MGGNMGSNRPPARILDDAAPQLQVVLARGANGFGVAVLHGAEAIYFLTPQQAEADGRQLLELAKLARNPGKCPCEVAG
jgi:hypothetical protein